MSDHPMSEPVSVQSNPIELARKFLMDNKMFDPMYIDQLDDFKDVYDDSISEIEDATLISTSMIPMPVWGEGYNNPGSISYKTIPRTPPHLAFHPIATMRQTSCHQCNHPFNDSTENSSFCRAMVYHSYHAHETELEARRQCDKCDAQSVFDGLEQRFINFGNRVLISHHLFNSFTGQYSSASMNVSSFILNADGEYESMKIKNDYTPFVSMATFTQAYLQFLNLQQRWRPPYDKVRTSFDYPRSQLFNFSHESFSYCRSILNLID